MRQFREALDLFEVIDLPFQHVFHGRSYGHDCHLDVGKDQWMLEEVEAALR